MKDRNDIRALFRKGARASRRREHEEAMLLVVLTILDCVHITAHETARDETTRQKVMDVIHRFAGEMEANCPNLASGLLSSRLKIKANT